MSDSSHGLPKAKVEKSYLTWSLWLIPIAAAAFCGYFLFQDFVFSGPTITIYFHNATGLEAKNSPVKYLGIRIGEIESLTLAKDRQHVAVVARLVGSAADVARQGSQFWIVQPEVKLGGISGLRTIISGNYVTVLPGHGARTNTFIGLSQPPLTPVKAIDIVLLTHDLDALELQSPIFYCGIQVGEVTDFRLARNASTVIVRARIREDYAPLVRVDSKFWNAGGIHIHAGLFSGLQISAESAETLVTGGIAFATPPDYGPAATNGTVFELHQNEDSSWKDWAPNIPLTDLPAGQNPTNSFPELNFRQP